MLKGFHPDLDTYLHPLIATLVRFFSAVSFIRPSSVILVCARLMCVRFVSSASAPTPTSVMSKFCPRFSTLRFLHASLHEFHSGVGDVAAANLQRPQPRHVLERLQTSIGDARAEKIELL